MPTRGRARRDNTRWPLARNVLLFVGGLAGVAHETLIANVERPKLLLVFAAMMGLPSVLRADGRRNGRTPDEES